MLLKGIQESQVFDKVNFTMSDHQYKKLSYGKKQKNTKNRILNWEKNIATQTDLRMAKMMGLLEKDVKTAFADIFYLFK
jgi:hypothetical protein